MYAYKIFSTLSRRLVPVGNISRMPLIRSSQSVRFNSNLVPINNVEKVQKLSGGDQLPTILPKEQLIKQIEAFYEEQANRKAQSAEESMMEQFLTFLKNEHNKSESQEKELLATKQGVNKLEQQMEHCLSKTESLDEELLATKKWVKQLRQQNEKYRQFMEEEQARLQSLEEKSEDIEGFLKFCIELMKCAAFVLLILVGVCGIFVFLHLLFSD